MKFRFTLSELSSTLADLGVMPPLVLALLQSGEFCATVETQSGYCKDPMGDRIEVISGKPTHIRSYNFALILYLTRWVAIEIQ